MPWGVTRLWPVVETKNPANAGGIAFAGRCGPNKNLFCSGGAIDYAPRARLALDDSGVIHVLRGF